VGVVGGGPLGVVGASHIVNGAQLGEMLKPFLILGFKQDLE
jgi:hypothetical protein